MSGFTWRLKLRGRLCFNNEILSGALSPRSKECIPKYMKCQHISKVEDKIHQKWWMLMCFGTEPSSKSLKYTGSTRWYICKAEMWGIFCPPWLWNLRWAALSYCFWIKGFFWPLVRQKKQPWTQGNWDEHFPLLLNNLYTQILLIIRQDKIR